MTIDAQFYNMLILHFILFSIHHCIVGAGPAGAILARQLSKAFPEDEITLIDKYFNGGNLNKVKNEYSNVNYIHYDTFTSALGLNQEKNNLPVYSKFEMYKNQDTIHVPKLSDLINLINELRYYMSTSNKISTLKGQVTSIKIFENHFQLSLMTLKSRFRFINKMRQDKINCDRVHLAIGGVPKPFFEMNGNPQQYNMYQSLDLLNSENVESILNKKQIYVVGNGATAQWMKTKLRNLQIPFYLVVSDDRSKTNSCVEEGEILSAETFKGKKFSGNDIIFYAHGLTSAKLPSVFLGRRKIEINKVKLTYGVIDFTTEDNKHLFYGLGAMSDSVAFITIKNAADRVIEKLKE
eukprot:NODE_143_length_15882_cov_1.296585.p3 type:complete len:351 gc:universal NODE_143_length_15882_cov_1.296585:10168-11220(+)